MTRPILTQERRAEIYTLLPIQAINCAEQTQEPMYDMRQKNGMFINLKNDIMRLEYEFRCKKLGIGIGMAMSAEQRRQWEQDIIEMYDTQTFVHVLTARAIGSGDFAGSDCFRRL